jgi:uncharacterized membrane protein
MGMLLIAALAFVGSHLLLSHPLRAPLVRMLGQRGFLGFYSLVSLASFVWMVLAYRAAPLTAALWPVGEVLWALVTLVMLFACVLLIGSFSGNPARPGGAGPTPPVPERAPGVFAITRHPMMWAFAIWAICHVLIFPVTKNLLVSAAIFMLALGGAAMQDRKKARLESATWPHWQARTSYWPLAALYDGRARWQDFGLRTWVGGALLWLAATWVHIPLSGWRAGIWHWMR